MHPKPTSRFPYLPQDLQLFPISPQPTLKLINAFAFPSPLTFLKTKDYVAPFYDHNVEITFKDDVNVINER